MSIQNYFGKPSLDFKKKNLKFGYFIGQKVMCKWSNNNWYSAYIVSLDETNKFKIKYIDGGQIEIVDYDNIKFCDDCLSFNVSELYEQDEQLIENQKLMINQISSLQETVKLLRKQKEDDQKRFEKLENEYQQLLVNWTTITDYMKRIDVLENKVFPKPPSKKKD